MELEELTLAEWGDALPDSGYEVFHKPAALSLLEKHSGRSSLRLLCGRKGQQIVGLFPVFINRLPLGVKIIASPPPGMHVPHLGPIVNSSSPKQRKIERVNQRFTHAVVDELDLNSRGLVHIVCSPEYRDPRPFTWDDLSVRTSFTYNIQLGDRDTDSVLNTFSKSRRREIRSGKKLDVSVELGDLQDVKQVYEQTKERFSEQNEYFGLSWPFVRDLYSDLQEDARVYVARGPDGSFFSGILVLYSNDSASFWLGGVRIDYEDVSMNTLLHWSIIRDIIEDPALESISRYDMVGAGEYRLSKYKSKYNPQLLPYYVVHSGGAKMEVAKVAYETLSEIRTRAPAVRAHLWLQHSSSR